MLTREDLLEHLQSEDLDDLVHDMKAGEASNINNGGVEAQVDYLLECGMSLEQIEAAVEGGSEAEADQE